MAFEWDPDKNIANEAKHGINFRQAEAIWDDPWRTVIETNTIGEQRFMTTGMIADRHWTVIWTPRRGNVRIISVRRARNEEIDKYEDTNDNG
ncbi:MAG: BrnT family toxin [Rhodobacteraceae bacterium]|nr:BrnT family toxin [Paracoccaceae bacterium]MDE2737899.1 BrnT family toxin [Paracoccaceae bacterium]